MNCFNDLIKLQLAMNNVKRFTSSRFALLSSIMKPIMCRESKEGNTFPTVDYCELSTRVYVNSLDVA